MNIKNEQTQNLARELSSLTGETMTAAITEALRERLHRVRRKQGRGMAERLLLIGEDCARHLTKKARSLDHGTFLYDEKGLPK